MSSSGLSRSQQYGVGFVSLAGVAALFAFTRGALLGQLTPASLTSSQLFTLAFLTGAWSVLVVLFVVNQFSHRTWGEAGVKLKPLE